MKQCNVFFQLSWLLLTTFCFASFLMYSKIYLTSVLYAHLHTCSDLKFMRCAFQLSIFAVNGELRQISCTETMNCVYSFVR